MWYRKKLTEKEQEQIFQLKMEIRMLEADKLAQEKELTRKKEELEYEFKRKEKDLRHDLDLKMETSRNEIANLKASLLVKHEQDIALLKSNFDKELIAEKTRLNKEFYEQMTSSLSELHSKGNHTTDFLKEMTLKMLEKAPAQVVYDGVK